MSNRVYRVTIKWQHHRWGPQIDKLATEGTSIRRALNNALLAFFSRMKNRKGVLDAHKKLSVDIERTKARGL